MAQATSTSGVQANRAESRRWLAWSLAAVSLLLVALFVWLEILHHRALGTRELLFDGGSALFGLAFPAVGAFLAARKPDNPIGWLMLVIGISLATAAAAHAYSQWAPLIGPTAPAAVQWVAWVGTWSWAPGWTLMVTFLLLLFPDGHLPSPRWRWAAWVPAVALTLETVGSMMDPNPTGHPLYSNPLGIHATHGLLANIGGFEELSGTGLTLAAAIACLIALIWRYRRSRGDEREQMKWFVYGGIAFIVLLPANTVLAEGRPVLEALAFVASTVLPMAIGVAIMKYHLYDIDVVIRKTVVLGLLAVFVTAVYALIVAGFGAAVGRRSPALAFAAAVVVAVAFQPVRERARLLADRLVYGKRATPYEVLTEFSAQAADAVSTDEVLPRLARIVAQGTGAQRARVWLRVADSFVPTAAWPEDDGARPPAAPAFGDALPSLPATESYPVTHAGALLGVIALEEDPTDPLTPAKSRLARDVAAQAGLVLHNVQLVEDLRASRQRIGSARDEERRRIQRRLQGGVENHLVRIGATFAAAEDAAADESGQRALAAIQALRADAADAASDLGALARGVYPPVLEQDGVVAALRAQAGASAVPVEVEAVGVARYPIDVEAAVYFCALEAMQNASKYAEASRLRVTISARDGKLTFDVADDGRGFDPDSGGYGSGLQGMVDRLETLGGSLKVQSAPGRGTTVSGIVRVRPEPVAT